MQAPDPAQAGEGEAQREGRSRRHAPEGRAGAERAQYTDRAYTVVSLPWRRTLICLLLALGPAAGSGESPAGVIQLVPPADRPAVGEVRVEALTGREGVERVVFYLDGEAVTAAEQPPFRVRIDLGPEPRPRALKAVAFAAGLRLGEDEILLNLPESPLEVRIVEVAGDPAEGSVELTGEVSLPGGVELDRVEFYWNRELGATLREAPYRARISTAAPQPEDHYRVVAHLADGDSLETAMLASGPAPAERIDVRLVRLYALVTDRKGRPRNDLRREDFELRHAGRRREIGHFARADKLPLTVGLAVDISGSMWSEMEEVRAAARRFLESILRRRDRALLIDFETRPRLVQAATSDLERLEAGLDSLRVGGVTALYDAVLFSLLHFGDGPGRKALVVLSDGVDTHSSFRPRRCIHAAREAGVPIYLIVFGGPPNPRLEREKMVVGELARKTGGRAYFVSGSTELTRIWEEIERELRGQYFLGWTSNRPLSRDELDDFRLEVAGRGLKVRAFTAGRF